MATKSRDFFSLLALASLAAAAVFEFALGDTFAAWRNVGLLLIALELVLRSRTVRTRRG